MLNIVKRILVISFLIFLFYFGYSSYEDKKEKLLGEKIKVQTGKIQRVYFQKTNPETNKENKNTLIVFGDVSFFAYETAGLLAFANNYFNKVIIPETVSKSGKSSKECCDKNRNTKGWNLENGCCGYSSSHNISDKAFVDSIFSTIQNPYIIAFDNGADFVLKMLCENQNIAPKNVFLLYNKQPGYFCQLKNTANITFFIKDYSKITFWQFLADNKTAINKNEYKINMLNDLFKVNKCKQEYDFSILSESFEENSPVKLYSNDICQNFLNIKVFSLEKDYLVILPNENLLQLLLK